MRIRDLSLTCLGIESTAHTFGVAVVRGDGAILGDVKSVYHPPLGRGIHPREAAQHHCDEAAATLKRCLLESGVRPQSISCIAFSAGPGLGPVLRVGASVARSSAIWLEKPLVAVHHAIGHFELACQMTGALDPLLALVSGGHTLIGACSSRRLRVYGETEDITLGNLLDVFAREAGLSSPGGPCVEELARKGSRLIELPYTVKGNDVSYSGLLTASLSKLKGGNRIEDVCFSLQEVAFSMLAEALERALSHTERRELMVAGGVAANRRLTEMLGLIAEEHGALFHPVSLKYSGDCGAQIAWTGLLAFDNGVDSRPEKSQVVPKWRIDEVDLPWRS